MANRSRRVSTSISPDQEQRLERVAEQVGLNKSDIIRMGTLEKMDDLDPEDN